MITKVRDLRLRCASRLPTCWVRRPWCGFCPNRSFWAHDGRARLIIRGSTGDLKRVLAYPTIENFASILGRWPRPCRFAPMADAGRGGRGDEARPAPPQPSGSSLLVLAPVPCCLPRGRRDLEGLGGRPRMPPRSVFSSLARFALSSSAAAARRSRLEWLLFRGHRRPASAIRSVPAFCIAGRSGAMLGTWRRAAAALLRARLWQSRSLCRASSVAPNCARCALASKSPLAGWRGLVMSLGRAVLASCLPSLTRCLRALGLAAGLPNSDLVPTTFLPDRFVRRAASRIRPVIRPLQSRCRGKDPEFVLACRRLCGPPHPLGPALDCDFPIRRPPSSVQPPRASPRRSSRDTVAVAFAARENRRDATGLPAIQGGPSRSWLSTRWARSTSAPGPRPAALLRTLERAHFPLSGLSRG